MLVSCYRGVVLGGRVLVSSVCVGGVLVSCYRGGAWGVLVSSVYGGGCLYHQLLTCVSLSHVQWRRQPDSLVPLCKFQIIICIHFFGNCCFHSQ